MGLFNFIRNQEPAGFNYKPRFYDEEKDDLKTRLSNLRKEGGDDVDAMKSRITYGLKKGKSDNRAYKSQLKRKSNVRIAVIALGLFVMAIIIMMAYYPVLLAALE